MRVVMDLDGTPREMEVTQSASTSTLGDLVVACGLAPLSPYQSVWVDDHLQGPDDLLTDAGVLEGSWIARDQRQPPRLLAGWSASVAAGLHAGAVAEVPPDRHLTIGRSPQADLSIASPSVSWLHVTVEREGDGLRIRDAGSANGTVVNGREVGPDGVHVDDGALITVGGAAVLLEPHRDEYLAPRPGSLPNVTPSGTTPFNRPPRPGSPPPPPPVLPPTRKVITKGSFFSLVAVGIPLVMAGAMIAVTKQLYYALFALMSPVMAVGSWWESKRRYSKESREEEKRYAGALTTFEGDLDRAAMAEAARLRVDLPDPGATLRRVMLPTTRLWQRRFGARDFLQLFAGIGDVRWQPRVEMSGRPPEDIERAIHETHMISAPVEVDLTNAGVVGIVGDREGALALARNLLVQAATHVGPADLTVGVFCDRGRDEAWSWAQWLPHTRRLGDGSGDRWVSADRQRSDALLRGLRDGLDGLPTQAALLVLDTDVLTEGRDAPARALLGHGKRLQSEAISGGHRPPVQVSGIVIAANEEQLPAACTVVVRVRPDADGDVERPGDLTKVEHAMLSGIDVATAREAAIEMARFEDPELIVPGAALPPLVMLPKLLGLDQITADGITELWQSSKGVSSPIGMGEAGVLTLDLVKDGPHGLVGGTTGSGKSEFLRAFVAGLAARNDPTKLTFILIDFKGGAAFATCERLPHTIGTVSNLEEQLADRALRALEAEMEYRQRMFAAAGEGIDNLDAYLATKPAEPMPRLLLVVDEFAMLAKDFPEVLKSLVSVAAVGRTLGVHMILATQRPAGVVNEDILANTNLRVALRVQSREDSSNVIGVPDASAISRNQRGRAYVKLGQDDITPVQTAWSTGRSELAGSGAVEAEPMLFGRRAAPRKPARPVDESAPVDLDLMIDAIVEANARAGYAPPRPVWPEPLGERVDLAGFATPADRVDRDRPPVPVVGGVSGELVTFGLADDPDHQRQIPAGWDMGRGNLIAVGIPGMGTSTTLATIALALAAATDPADLDILTLDMGPGDLAPLAELPHSVGYVGSGTVNREQQVRLLKFLRAEVDRRKASPTGNKRMLVLIDGLATLRDEFNDYDGMAYLDFLYRAYADGPEIGMYFAIATARSRAVPSAMDEVTTQKWLFRLADRYDYSSAGVPATCAPPAVPGRCVLAETRLQTHVATPFGGLAAAVADVRRRWPDARSKPTVVGQLPDRVTVGELGAVAEVAGEPWRIPVGIRESDLTPSWLETFENEHILIAGTVRSGKSTLLLAMAEAIRAGAREQGAAVQVWGVCGRRSPLQGAGLDRVAVGKEDLPPLLAAARMQDDPLVLLIDDAEQFDDDDQAIAGLLGAGMTNLHVIAAGRSDDLRSLYSHWTKIIRKSRCGVLLNPVVDYDGDLLGVNLPRKSPAAMRAGRGYAAVAGSVEFLQAAEPDDA